MDSPKNLGLSLFSVGTITHMIARRLPVLLNSHFSDLKATLFEGSGVGSFWTALPAPTQLFTKLRQDKIHSPIPSPTHLFLSLSLPLPALLFNLPHWS